MIYAVIGANYGDEGKGLVTDYLVSQANRPLVVRHNGGSQAGHTVKDPKGLRHVFHSIGAGALQGAPTFLSHFFVMNPFLFAKEYAELKILGVDVPPIYLDPRMLITTPFDVLLNQAAERKRGNGRHGSVGAGVGETIARAEAGYKITPLTKEDELVHALKVIQFEYVPERMKKLGVDELEITEPEEIEHFVDSYVKDFKAMMSVCKVQKWENMNWLGDIIFEGAQGLLLDSMDKKRFPFVSRSRTGLENITQMLSIFEDKPVINAYYTTRAYLTRHGAGPLENEVEDPYCEDLTNTPNEWQGTLRFGILEAPFVAQNILNDMKSVDWEVIPTIAMTCCDHISKAEESVRQIAKQVGAHTILESFGPTRKDVKEFVL